ncbi:MAG: GAF domain-containing sensor histidine kinase, partial [Caldilineaceae bacterium]|nr:GAF domain-containing sensor histidine kinase [Caldilineaceae bacterium]
FADPDDYAGRLAKAYADGSFTDRFECQVLPENGRADRWLEHWSQPIREGIYKGGRIEQYTDITDRKRLEVAEREQREFAEALREISTVLTSSLALDEVLSGILDSLGRVVPHDSATITLLADDHVTVTQHQRVDGDNIQAAVDGDHLPAQHNPFVQQMFETKAPVIVADLQAHPHIDVAAAGVDARAYVVAPILLQDDIMGFINVMSEQVDFFTENHAERLTAFSRLAAIALQNARLFEQSHRLATLEERQRLARELHDSVSQTLFTCRTMSETVLRRWDKDPQSAYKLARDVNQLITTALMEMRVLLLELRPNALTQISLKQLFEQYLNPIQKRRQFDLALHIDEIGPLPAPVQLALYRITQEALNNIDKHAQAGLVEIRATDDADKVTLIIRDDGQGFSVESVSPTSLGLEIMRERAEKIGASLDVTSRTRGGTQIQVIWCKEDVQ